MIIMLWELGFYSLITITKFIFSVLQLQIEQPDISGSSKCQNVGFSFASYYQSHMVLQRAPVHAKLWGYTEDILDEVTVVVTGADYQETFYTLASEGTEGKPVWFISIDPLQAGGPYNITATSKNCSQTLKDVLFGDVWLCSGQSNMAYSLHMIDNAEEEMNNSVNYPNMRVFQTEMKYSSTPQEDLIGISMNWQLPTPKQIGTFSAVCWLYGRYLYDKYKLPVGLVQSAWGGTRIEAWSPREANHYCFPDGPDGAQEQNAASVLYNAMIHPFQQMPIYGAIWYQGEQNREKFEYYGCSVQQMVRYWRQEWHANSPTMDAMFPFGEVQIGPQQKNGTDMGFPGERWAQTYGYGFDPNPSLERFFMAVIIDTPDFNSSIGPIHPRYKRQAARRLLLSGLVVAYGDSSEGLWQGPIPTGYQVQGSNLMITLANGTVELEVRDTTSTLQYELCCAVSTTAECDPQIENDTKYRWLAADFNSATSGRLNVTIPCDMSHDYIMGLRYAWRETPCPILEQCAFYAKENSLPVPPFYYKGRIM